MHPEALKQLQNNLADCTEVVEASKETLDVLIERVERMFKVRDGWSRLPTQGLQ